LETLRDQYLDQVYAFDVNVGDPEQCLKEICLAAADSFALTGVKDFYTLHAVTGSRAVWAILNALDWPDSVHREVLAALWRTILFTHLVRRDDTPAPTDDTDPLPLWTDLTAAGLRSRDSHITKLIYTCADFYDRWRDRRHHQIAAAAIARRQAGGRLRGTSVGSKAHLYAGK